MLCFNRFFFKLVVYVAAEHKHSSVKRIYIVSYIMSIFIIMLIDGAVIDNYSIYILYI